MGNHYYQQNSIPMARNQNLIMPDLQQESQFPMRMMQEERRDQYFRNEMSPPQINRSTSKRK